MPNVISDNDGDSIVQTTNFYNLWRKIVRRKASTVITVSLWFRIVVQVN